jgi:hypothetical protein
MPTRKVSTSKELLAALDNSVTEITVSGTLSGMGSLRLPPGVGLAGGTLVFGARGLVLSADNSLEEIDIKCPAQEIAIATEVTQADLGALTLRGVSTVGQVFLVADESIRAGTIFIDGLVINEADLRGRAERPHGYGVDALQGTLTIWNRSPDPDVVLHAEIKAVSAGSEETPIRGSGVGGATGRLTRQAGPPRCRCLTPGRWS